MTLFFSGSDLVVRLTNRLLFLWWLFMSGSVDVATDDDPDEDEAADDEDDAAMALLHGAVVYPDSVW